MIPHELTEIDQWVEWKACLRDGRETKVPVRGHTPIDITNPSNYLRFIETGEKRGFVFTEGDPYVGIDLDKCTLPDGTLEEWAQEIVDQIDSYTERSQSGQGVHIIARGSLPRNIRCGSIEMYDHARFFVMTGNVYDPYRVDIEYRQFEVDSLFDRLSPSIESLNPARVPGGKLTDEEVLERASRARNSESFLRLWSGDASGQGGDHSGADLALCSHLAFWCGNDEDQIDRLFRKSGLYREKWDREDYRSATIKRSLQGEVFSGPKDKPPDPNPVPEHIQGNHNILAWHVMQRNKIVYDHDRDMFFVYGQHRDCPGVWTPLSPNKTEMDRYFYPLCPELGLVAKGCLVDEATRSLKVAAVLPKGFHDQKGLVAFKDCVVDMDSYADGDFDILPHAPEHHLTKHLNVNWREDCPIDEETLSHCPNFDRLLDHGLSRDKVSLDEYLLRRKAVMQMIGYCMLPHNDLQKFHMIQGRTRSGKSLLVSVIQQLIPQELSSSLELSLLGERWSMGALVNKQINICSESDVNDKTGEDRLKRVTGGDTVQVEHKNKPLFETCLPVHFIMVCNSRPRLYDSSGATHKRLEIILWDGETLHERDQDHDMLQKIIPEIPWIAKIALLEIAEVLKTRKWARSPMTIAALDDYETRCNPVKAFVIDRCEVGSEYSTSSGELFDNYEDYCHEIGISKPLGKHRFLETLQTLYNITEGRRTSRIRKPLVGIRLADLYGVEI